jgi:predicted P-loop ATPase/DNA polymerase I-like protein with 3'-5' exonuclease and polymerase domains
MPNVEAFPLYNLPAVRTLSEHDNRDDDVVIVVEGEKDVDSLVQLGRGFTATTTHNGVGKWQKHNTEWLNGLNVVLIPDNDNAGRQHMRVISQSLSGIARSVRIINLPGLSPKDDVSDWIRAGGDYDELWDLIDGQEAELEDIADPSWRERLTTTSKGIIRSNDANLIKAVRWAPELHGKLIFNTFSQQINVNTPLLDNFPNDYPRQFSDEDETRILEWAQDDVFPSMARNKVSGAVQLVSSERSFDPLRNYVSKLEWDGEARLNRWLQDYAGATGNDEYISAVGRMWLVSGIARALDPGCQVDHMLVLEGPQGIYKSSLLRALAVNDEWFNDDVAVLGDKDAKLALHGRWIIEVKELEAMNKAEIGGIKKYIDTRTDKIRVPYGKVVKDFPRRCILAGTFNPTGKGYLKDASGGRRFWPVTVNKHADIDGMERIRDQLWAEAKSAYLAGEKWWTHEAALEKLLQEEQSARYQRHPIDDLVETYITHECFADDSGGKQNIRREWSVRKEPLTKFIIADFYADVLMLGPEYGKSFTPIIGSAMCRLGWVGPKTIKVSGKPKWGFTAPYVFSGKGKGKNSGSDNGGGGTNISGGAKSAPGNEKVGGKGKSKGKIAMSLTQNTTTTSISYGEDKTCKNSLDINSSVDLKEGPNEGLRGLEEKFQTFALTTSLSAARRAVASALADGICGFDFETVGLVPGVGDNRVRLMQIWRDDHSIVVDLDGVGGLEKFKDILEGQQVVAFNGLFEMRWLRAAGIDLVVDDLKLAWASVYGGGTNLAQVVKKLLGIEMDKSLQTSDWSGKLSDGQLQYAMDDSKYTLLAWRRMLEFMTEGQVTGYFLFRDAQRPVLRMMENGVMLDTKAHSKLIKRFQKKRDWASNWLNRHVADVTNWSSGPQVAAWLKKVLPPGIKRKWPRTDKTRNFKTGAQACAEFAGDVDQSLRRIFWAMQILSVSKKMVSTYGDSMLEHVGDDGRLRGKFSIAQAITGRMSSSKPNMQNMPAKGPSGAKFRGLFIAPKGRKLVVADYSQIEVRVGGLLADEQVLADMFGRGYDVHAATGAKMLGVTYEDVYDVEADKVRSKYGDARTKAKAVTFGMQYGMGDKSLAKKMGIAVAEARKMIRQWEEAFPKVAEWREESAVFGRKNRGLVLHSGRTITLAYKPSPQSCYNYPVQGTAGDVMYAALAELDRRLDESELDAIPMLVIHDEVVLEVADGDVEAAKTLLEESMVAGFLRIFPGGGTTKLVEASERTSWAKEKE